MPQDESHVSVGGLLALGYGRLQILRKEARSANYMEDKLTKIGSKWPKEKKIRSEVRESNLLAKEIKKYRSIRKMDRGKLIK